MATQPSTTTADPSPYTLHLRAQDLQGKTAVITGASKGIGRAVALHLASRGCHIIGTCSSPQTLHLIDTISSSVAKIYQTSGAYYPNLPTVAGVALDLCSATAAADLGAAVRRLSPTGRVHILVLNAALTGATPIGAKENAELVPRFNLANVQTPMLMVDELVREKLFEKNSRIVLTSSVRSQKPAVNAPMYAATKAAGEALVRTWAEAFGGKHSEFDFMAGTTANSVFTGVTATSALDRRTPEAVKKLVDELVPQQSIPSLAKPEDVADVIGLLCGQDARWITGSIVCADGGGVKIC